MAAMITLLIIDDNDNGKVSQHWIALQYLIKSLDVK